MKFLPFISGGSLHRWFMKSPPGYEKLTPTNVKKMEYDQQKGFSAMLENPAVAIITAEVIKFFKASGGVNYVSFCAWDKEIGEIEINVRPKNGKTKAQIIAELKQEIAALKAHNHSLQPTQKAGG